MTGRWVPWFELDESQLLTLDSAKRLHVKISTDQGATELIRVSVADTSCAARRRVSPYEGA